MRRAAIRLLPLLVTIWATLAIVGGAIHLAKQADNTYDSAAKAGLSLCAVSVAIMARYRIRAATKYLWNRVLFPDPVLRRPPRRPGPRHTLPLARPPTLQLLQVSRT